MAIHREAVHRALFDRLSAIPGLEFSTRRALNGEEVGSVRQPALVLRAVGSSPQHDDGLPDVWIVGAVAVLYARNAAKDGSTDTVLNDLTDAIEAALELQPGESGDGQTTLGGVVERAWISGDVVFGAGESSDQAMAMVPIEMMVIQQ